MQSAQEVARRATCPTRPAGALLYTYMEERALGYEGSAVGQGHCRDLGCILENGRCRRAVRAELNAILFAARLGLITEGSTLVCTHPVTHDVVPYLANAGVIRVFCPTLNNSTYTGLELAGIEVIEKDDII